MADLRTLSPDDDVLMIMNSGTIHLAELGDDQSFCTHKQVRYVMDPDEGRRPDRNVCRPFEGVGSHGWNRERYCEVCYDRYRQALSRGEDEVGMR